MTLQRACRAVLRERSERISDAEREVRGIAARRASPGRKGHPAHVREAVVEAVRSGVSLNAAAGLHGVSHEAARLWTQAVGVKSPRQSAKERKKAREKDGRVRFPPEVRARAVDAVRAGASYEDAGSLVHASRDSVWSWCRAAGVTSRPVRRTRKCVSDAEARSQARRAAELARREQLRAELERERAVPL